MWRVMSGRSLPSLHSPGMTLWSSSSLSMTSFWTPGYRVRMRLCRQMQTTTICCTCSGHWGRHVRRHWNLFTNSPKAFPPHVWPGSSDSCIPSERGRCYVGSTASSSIGVVQMRLPRSKSMAWAGHLQGGVWVAECSLYHSRSSA